MRDGCWIFGRKRSSSALLPRPLLFSKASTTSLSAPCWFCQPWQLFSGSYPSSVSYLPPRRAFLPEHATAGPAVSMSSVPSNAQALPPFLVVSPCFSSGQGQVGEAAGRTFTHSSCSELTPIELKARCRHLRGTSQPLLISILPLGEHRSNHDASTLAIGHFSRLPLKSRRLDFGTQSVHVFLPLEKHPPPLLLLFKQR